MENNFLSKLTPILYNLIHDVFILMITCIYILYIYNRFMKNAIQICKRTIMLGNDLSFAEGIEIMIGIIGFRLFVNVYFNNTDYYLTII